MRITEALANAAFRLAFRICFRLEKSDLAKVPATGPLLLIANHVSTLEGPLLYVFLRPRAIQALAKKELWDHWFTRSVMNLWHSIPVDRENMGRESMDQCLAILERNEILAIAPEGTRSKDGSLQEGKAGVAFIAHKKQAPIIPVATMGIENFPDNIKRLRRTPVRIAVGEPFELVSKSGRLDAQTRQAIVDEMMIRIAALMPPEKRGFYQDRPPVYTHTRNLPSPTP